MKSWTQPRDPAWREYVLMSSPSRLLPIATGSARWSLETTSFHMRPCWGPAVRLLAGADLWQEGAAGKDSIRYQGTYAVFVTSSHPITPLLAIIS